MSNYNNYFAIFQAESEEEISTIVRIYDDIEWLQHCLLTQNKSNGCIVSFEHLLV